MQDPSTFQQIKPQFPEQEQLLKCPRCESMNTKFCYYNNYNLSQPRHFCKNCRRYWTKGGALRNIPVGGGTRKNSKRPSTTVEVAAKRSSSSSTITTSASSAPIPNPTMENSDPGHDPSRIYSSGFDIHGSFSSLLASNGLSGQFGGLMEGMDPDVKMVELGEFGENMNPGHGLNSGSSRKSGVEQPLTATMAGNGPDNFIGIVQNGESGCWSGGGNGWPDLAIYTPGSSYQ